MKKKISFKKRGGFTLIELIVVLIIIGVMATFVIPKIVGSDEGAVQASMLNDARAAIASQENHYVAKNIRRYCS